MAAHEVVERCEGGRLPARTRARAGEDIEVGHRSRGGYPQPASKPSGEDALVVLDRR